MPMSLTARLLAVSRHAYAIKQPGKVPQTLDAQRIGYRAEPDGFAAGGDRIDAALVGETEDGIILGFRGTLPPDSPDHLQVIRDWANDVDAELVANPDGPNAGKVHKGFLGALDALWPELQPAITALSSPLPSKPIYVTGHSKGGPLANLAAFRLRRKRPDTPVFVCTFAGARAGDPAFATAYDHDVAHSVRWEYADDIVPHLPPSEEFVVMFRHVPQIAQVVAQLHVGYGSVGELHFINWDGQVEGASPTLGFRRFFHLAEQMATFGVDKIVAAHSIAPGSGYDRGVGP